MTTISVADYRKLSAKKPKAAKYHNVKTVVDGITFDSKKEAEYYKVLLLGKKSGLIKKIERQVSFPYLMIFTPLHSPIPNFEKKGRYVCDFRITYSDGKVEVIDAKGVETEKFKRDKKVMKALYGIDIKIV